jgi:pyruvate-ferredoxin/flavodoxin oxidoreductase
MNKKNELKNSVLKETMDGNRAAAYASYAFTEMAAIYPITPSSPMAEIVDEWGAQGKKNLFGNSVELVEMQSEAGAISAMHGALDSGILASSYSASQGLMLMIPTMYRIAGQLKPGVIHVASRNVATHAISILAEHSDVMACRNTGFALLASSNVQQAMDLAAVAHLSAIKGSVPFLHFFDGFRTSHEVQKIECLDYNDLANLLDWPSLRRFRKRALNPEYPVLRTVGMNSDTYFQSREASNAHYDTLPETVQWYMDKLGEITSRRYRLFDYYGAPDAEYVIAGIGSVAGTVQETVDYLIAKGEKVGYVEVHLYRPFSTKHFLDTLPVSLKKLTVLDRTKEPGAVGEPLFEDVCSALKEDKSKAHISIFAGRFGLACKNTTPAHVISIYENMKTDSSKKHFTVGINDDVTNLSLQVGPEISVSPRDIVSCKFWGLGSDGTVGANKNAIKIIGDHTDLNVQAYFEYDGKKSGGVTRSHLRFGKSSIRSTNLVTHANFVACHNAAYVGKYDLTGDLQEEGNLLLACPWKPEELDDYLPVSMRREIARKKINIYIIDATAIAAELGLGNRTNAILQAAFFKISGVIPISQAVEYMKEAIKKTYGNKGDKIVNLNCDAVDRGVSGAIKVNIPPFWADLPEEGAESSQKDKPRFITEILEPVNAMKGDNIPVSAFLPHVDGTMPQGSSKYEKRGIAINVPVWKVENCLQCNMCSYVCPHAAIRPFLLDDEEAAASPVELEISPAKGSGYRYRLQVAVLDCQGCGSCVNVCPAKEKALVMEPLSGQFQQNAAWEYLMSLPENKNPYGKTTVKGSQFEQPLLEFPGACAGCGETPYAKLVTQLYGDRMYLATATGCAQVWSTSFPSFPYTVNKQGHGPAMAGSLFENNAEFGFGIYKGATRQRNLLREKISRFMEMISDMELREFCSDWLNSFEDGEESKGTSAKLNTTLKTFISQESEGEEKELYNWIMDNTEHLVKKSVWMFGGDGWAYDIGFGGLDHVIASGENVNILVFDTEVYSNTGGQSSKATPSGAVAQFATSGKKTAKKDLGMMAMNYGSVYVAQIAMGADPAQTLRAIIEAEAYNGPSLVIAYAPCINHGLKSGMGKAQEESKRAVASGYWHLYRYNPQLVEKGKNPFTLDSKAPSADFLDFLRGEVRYTALEHAFPEEAEHLFKKAKTEAEARYAKYRALAGQLIALEAR